MTTQTDLNLHNYSRKQHKRHNIPYIDFLRSTAIFGVVLLHSAMPLLGSPAQDELVPGLVYSALCMFCVPVIIMISGALLLDGPPQVRIGEFYSKRFARIALPLLGWSVVYYLATCLVQHQPLNVITFFKRMLTGLWAGPLWFLYMIAGVYLMVPFIKPAFADARSPLGPLFVAITFGITAINFATRLLWGHDSNTFLTSAVIPHYIGYFVLGHLLNQRSVRVPGGMATLLALFAVCTGVDAASEYAATRMPDMLPNTFFNYHQPLAVLSAAAVFLIFKRAVRALPHWAERSVRLCSRLSFGIFLSHALVLFLLTGALPLLFQPGEGLDWLTGGPWVGPLLTALVVFVLSAALAYGCERAAKVLNGWMAHLPPSLSPTHHLRRLVWFVSRKRGGHFR